MNKLLLFGGIGVVALALLFAPGPEGPGAAILPQDSDRVPPEVVVEWMLRGEQPVRLVDTRPESAFLASGIRGAVSLPADSVTTDRIATLPVGHLLVVYGESGDDADGAFGALRAVREDVLVLDGGYEAWKTRILEPREPEASATEADWALFQERLAVSNYLLGRTDAAPLPTRTTVAPVLRPRGQIKNEGC